MIYKYIGDGAGVPGLPHEISDEEAQGLGVTDLLKAALENGSYAEAPSSAQDKLEKKSKRPSVVIEDPPWQEE